jgi:hypothetical protein
LSWLLIFSIQAWLTLWWACWAGVKFFQFLSLLFLKLDDYIICLCWYGVQFFQFYFVWDHAYGMWIHMFSISKIDLCLLHGLSIFFCSCQCPIFCFNCGLWFHDNIEKSWIEAQIRAAEAASRRREEMELKMQREREREAARIALQKVYLIIDFHNWTCICGSSWLMLL